MTDVINHPPHYQAVCHCPSCGHAIEAIQITERFGFRVGNALKYLIRAGRKGDAATDLGKARWYVDRELAAQPTQRTPREEEALRAAQLRNHGGCDDAPVSVTSSARTAAWEADRARRKAADLEAAAMLRHPESRS